MKKLRFVIKNGYFYQLEPIGTLLLLYSIIQGNEVARSRCDDRCDDLKKLLLHFGGDLIFITLFQIKEDSGSPLVCLINQRWKLIGITSHTTPRNQECSYGRNATTWFTS